MSVKPFSGIDKAKWVLDPACVDQMETMALCLRKDVIQLIDHAGSGHIGGSMSSLELLILLYAYANISPQSIGSPQRDRIILSSGHISPAYYAVLAAFGFVSRDSLFEYYRQKEGVFEGHPSNLAAGVEWCNGCLGQGLSEGCGEALAQVIHGYDRARVYVLMGDGEQSKGQIQEAIELAANRGLSNLTCIIDNNEQQSSGERAEILDVHIASRYEGAGWQVLRIDGHDFNAIYSALKTAEASDRPTCILARTVMGKGIREIENDWHYHGKRLSPALRDTVLSRLDSAIAMREPVRLPVHPWDGKNESAPCDALPPVVCGEPRLYGVGDVIDGRKTCANTLKQLIRENPAGTFCVLDCDLASGLGIDDLNSIVPHALLECGIQEHNAMDTAGGLAASGIRTFYMGFGAFALGEAFNQLRVIDQNHVPLKVIATHCGVDVGQDGKSHQMIDYIALGNALLGFELILPADPNQTDKALRYLAANDKPGILALPRSNLPVLCDEKGEAIFGASYSFEYGKADWIRRGGQAVILTYGVMVQYALEACAVLEADGVSCGVLSISAPKELDREKLLEAASTGLIAVVEDHNRRSGLGSLVSMFLTENSISCKAVYLGVKRYGISASAAAQFSIQGLTASDIARQIRHGLQ